MPLHWSVWNPGPNRKTLQDVLAETANIAAINAFQSNPEIIPIPSTSTDEEQINKTYHVDKIVKTGISLSYVYRTPRDEKKCYRFYTQGVRKHHMSVICSTCVLIYQKQTKSTKKHPKYRMTNGYFMKDDPELEHLEGCIGEDYDELMKNYVLDEDRTGETPHVLGTKSNFYLHRVEKEDSKGFLYRLPSDTEKCYRFCLQNSEMGHDKLAACTNCKFINEQVYKKVSLTKKIEPYKLYRYNELGFIDEPQKYHYKSCGPMKFKEAMAKFKFEDGITGIISHQIGKCLEQFKHEEEVPTVPTSTKRPNIEVKLEDDPIEAPPTKTPKVEVKIEDEDDSYQPPSILKIDDDAPPTKQPKVEVKIEDDLNDTYQPPRLLRKYTVKRVK